MGKRRELSPAHTPFFPFSPSCGPTPTAGSHGAHLAAPAAHAAWPTSLAHVPLGPQRVRAYAPQQHPTRRIDPTSRAQPSRGLHAKPTRQPPPLFIFQKTTSPQHMRPRHPKNHRARSSLPPTRTDSRPTFPTPPSSPPSARARSDSVSSFVYATAMVSPLCSLYCSHHAPPLPRRARSPTRACGAPGSARCVLRAVAGASRPPLNPARNAARGHRCNVTPLTAPGAAAQSVASGPRACGSAHPARLALACPSAAQRDSQPPTRPKWGLGAVAQPGPLARMAIGAAAPQSSRGLPLVQPRRARPCSARPPQPHAMHGSLPV
jgi:hypothetical protein